MIDFEGVWLPQIIRYARLIASGQVEDEWLCRTKPVTSLGDPDELYCQLFDDLDAEGIWADPDNRSQVPPELAEAIGSFLSKLKAIDQSDASLLVSSRCWADAKEAAREVVALS